MKVTNDTKRLEGIQTLKGTVFLQPGQSRDDLEMSESQATRASRIKGLTVEGKPSADPVKPAKKGGASIQTLGITVNADEVKKAVDAAVALIRDEVEAKDAELSAANAKIAELEAALKATTSLKAVHRGGGSWSVMRGEVEVKQSMTKEDAEAFNSLSDEDKEKYVV